MAVATVPVRSAARPQPVERRRPALRVVGQRRPLRRPRAAMVALGAVITSLLFVVGGHALLISDQIRLTDAQSQLAAEQSVHRQAVLQVSSLETPARIVQEAQDQLHMTTPAQVVQLPYVPLNVALPAPKVTPAPAPPPAKTTTATATATNPTTTATQSSSAPGR